MIRFFFLALSNFFFFLGNALFHLFPIYLGEMGASRTYIGLIMGATTATLVVFTFLLRNRIDFLDKKKYLLLSAAASLFIYAGYFFQADFYTLPFLRFFQGLAYAVGFTFGSAWVVEMIPPEKRAGLIGIFGISGAMTNAVGPYAGEKIIGLFGFPGLFLSAGLCALLWFLSLLCIKNIPAERTLKPENPMATEPSMKAYAAVIPLALLFGTGFSSLFSFISHYASGLSLVPVSAFYLSYTAALTLTRIFFTGTLNRLSRRRVIFGSFLIAVLSLAAASLLSFYPWIWLLGLAGVFYGSAHGFLYPALNMAFIDQTPQRGAKATLLFILFFNLGNTLSSFVLGLLAQWVGYATMYFISALTVLLGSLYYFRKPFARVFAQGLRKLRIPVSSFFQIF